MKAIIMAGGKGTRIVSITRDEIPKPMLKVGEKTILEHQIEVLKKSEISEIVIIIGYLGEKIKEYFKDGKEFGVKISYIEENPQKPLGTAGALYYLKKEINTDFILIYGDIFFNIDFKKMIEFHKEKQSKATLLTHPNSHPYDSDLIIADEQNRILTIDSKENIRNYEYRNIVNSGIYIFSQKIFKYIEKPEKLSLEHDIVSKMLENNEAIYSYKSTEYIKDMGTPERYEAVNRDFENKICDKRNLSNKQKCIFIDRDGTINEHVGFLRNKEQFNLIQGVSQAIKEINNSEYLCIVITNQPVIARGEVTFKQLDDIHKKLETLLGKEQAYIDDLYYCPHHPDKGFEGEIPELKYECDCRKPKIGMIKKAVEKYNIDLSNSIMIGDSTLDIKLAQNAGMKSILVKTGQAGLDGKYDVIPSFVSDNLLEAIQKILYKDGKKEYNGF